MKRKSPGPSDQPQGNQKTNPSDPTLLPTTGNTFDEFERALSIAYDLVVDTKAHVERLIELHRKAKRER